MDSYNIFVRESMASEVQGGNASDQMTGKGQAGLEAELLGGKHASELFPCTIQYLSTPSPL